MPADDHLLANGFYAGRPWLFDLSQPTYPKVLIGFRWWLATLAGLGMVPAAAWGQSAIVVLVGDVRTAAPIEGVILGIDGRNVVPEPRSDQLGQITVTALAAGQHVFEASRIGYKTARSEPTFSQQTGDTLRITLLPVLLTDLVHHVALMADSGTQVASRQDSLAIIDALAASLDSTQRAMVFAGMGSHAESAHSLLQAARSHRARGSIVSSIDSGTVHLLSIGRIGESAAVARLVWTRCVDRNWASSSVVRYTLTRTKAGWVIDGQKLVLLASGSC